MCWISATCIGNQDEVHRRLTQQAASAASAATGQGSAQTTAPDPSANQMQPLAGQDGAHALRGLTDASAVFMNVALTGDASQCKDATPMQNPLAGPQEPKTPAIVGNDAGAAAITDMAEQPLPSTSLEHLVPIDCR